MSWSDCKVAPKSFSNTLNFPFRFCQGSLFDGEPLRKANSIPNSNFLRSYVKRDKYYCVYPSSAKAGKVLLIHIEQVKKAWRSLMCDGTGGRAKWIFELGCEGVRVKLVIEMLPQQNMEVREILLLRLVVLACGSAPPYSTIWPV